MESSQAPTQPSGRLESLPNEVIFAIMENLTTYEDVTRLTAAYGHAYRLYSRYKYSVLSSINDKVVFRSNMDIAFITFALLRIKMVDLPQAIASMTTIADKPHLVVKCYLNDCVLQREFLLLAGRVNRLCETFARVKNPERFWKELAYKFAAFCPKDGRESAGSPAAGNAGRNEIAHQFWDICKSNVGPLPRFKHSRETLEAIQRSFWAHELCCRSSIIEDLEDDIYGDSGLWIFDELPTPGVTRFLHLMIDVLAQRGLIHRASQNDFASPHSILSNDRVGLWSSICFLGVRAWADVLEKPWTRLGWPTVDALQVRATQVLDRYVTGGEDSVYWYYTGEMEAWRVKRLTVLGQSDGQPLGMMSGVFERDRTGDEGSEEGVGDAHDEVKDVSESDDPDELQGASGDDDAGEVQMRGEDSDKDWPRCLLGCCTTGDYSSGNGVQ
ncbi:Uncharacterized protein TPAR_08263 [Tolypocladium paradoxum]|uniref:Uncharacterized protein n=1 Tax=Tolypocladium paradoxum TaxID=94208 RepID=A0A2S4KN31_9HYPO|nr:Uncharacterized protein TPAR_08263 [Tolypocladium paradoxum]